MNEIKSNILQNLILLVYIIELKNIKKINRKYFL